MPDEFEREKVAYEQAHESQRQLDQSMWQVPLIGMTLTGGLWFAVGSSAELGAAIRATLLGFAAVGDVALVFVLVRLRRVIDVHLKRIQEFEGLAYKPWSPWGLHVVTAFSVVLLLASLVSLGGIWYVLRGEDLMRDGFSELEVIGENPSAIAVRDKFPVNPGHTLIIPRRSVASVFELTDQELLDCWKLIRSERERLRAEMAVDGFNVGINDGEVAGQTVRQAHIHLIPRYKGDNPEPRGGVRAVVPGRANPVTAD